MKKPSPAGRNASAGKKESAAGSRTIARVERLVAHHEKLAGQLARTKRPSRVAREAAARSLYAAFAAAVETGDEALVGRVVLATVPLLGRTAELLLTDPGTYLQKWSKTWACLQDCKKKYKNQTLQRACQSLCLARAALCLL